MSRPLAALAAVAALALPVLLPAAPSPPKPRLPARERIRVAFVLTDNANVMDFAGPWETFQDVSVSRRGRGETQPFEIYTVGDRREPVTMTGGVRVVPAYTFADAPAPHVVVVGAQRGSDAMIDWLRRVAPDADVVMSVCTGAFKLARAGLLDGHRATTHHEFFDALERDYPRVEVQRGRRWVESTPKVYTAGGLTSGIDLALHVVTMYFDEATADRTALYMEHAGGGWKDATATPVAARGR
jgi:transcriptional regulator GlxA family with amidase domain